MATTVLVLYSTVQYSTQRVFYFILFFHLPPFTQVFVLGHEGNTNGGRGRRGKEGSRRFGKLIN